MSYINISCPSKTINLEEYKRLLKNKQKMFDMTFPTPEIDTEIMMKILIKKFYKRRRLLNKIKIYLRCLIKT